MSRDYYNRRVGKDGGPPRLTIEEVAAQVSAAYLFVDQQGYLQRSFGYHCVDAGDVPGLEGFGLRDALYLATGIKIPGYVPDYIKTADEAALFTIAEYVHDHVAVPDTKTGYFHNFSGCGWHYNCREARFDEAVARSEWRDKLNAVLRFYEGGFELSASGEMVRTTPNGMVKLVEGKLSPKVSNTDQAKVANAVRTFHLGRSTREQRKQAVRDLVDVLEFHRAAVKDHLSKDEQDLFNIANNFALRHHRPGQKDDYDDAWLTWLFYVYLATVHLVLRRVHGATETDAHVPPSGNQEDSNDDIPF